MLAAYSASLIIFAVCSRQPIPETRAADPPLTPPRMTVYDPEPGHLWNRLHEAIYVRLDGAGADEPGELDPLLWQHSPFLEKNERSDRAVAVLDEYIAKRGEKLIADPGKRALLQRDLWALFDAVAPPAGAPAVREKMETRTQLARRLAAVLPRLALTADEIKALPDNYAEAVAAGKFPKWFDAGRLWAADGPWVLVGNKNEAPLARTHAEFFGGRSAFFVFLRCPDGREQTLKHLADLQARGANAKPPAGGVYFALVRQMLLFDAAGRITLSPIVESVQIRGLGDHELKLSRKELMAGKPSLAPLGPEDREREYHVFMGRNVGVGRTKVLDTCVKCHMPDRLESHARTFPPFQSLRPALTASTRDDETTRARRAKWNSYEWGLLQGLTLAAPRD